MSFARRLTLFSYYKKPISKAYEALKCGLGACLCFACIWALVVKEVESGFAVAIIALVSFGVLLHGLRSFFKKDNELPFLEINDESLRYRSIAEFGVSAVKNSEIEFIIIGGDHIEIAQKGFGGVISIQYQGTTPDDLSLLFNKVAPQATVKIRIEAEED